MDLDKPYPDIVLLNNRRFFLAIALIALFCLGFSGTTFSAINEVEKDLGKKGSAFGSTGQANALLVLIRDNPASTNVKISYTTDFDIVVMEYSKTEDSLVRIHQKNNGSGTTEVWRGDVLSRLKAAAAGGSLNDTTTGKKPGSFSTF